MWYREAKQNSTVPSEEISEALAAAALDFWSQQEKITATPNLSVVFSKQMTEELIQLLSPHMQLAAKDPSDIYASIKNKAESYASLLYRELGMRYYLLLIDKRIREDLDQEEFTEILKKEMVEATTDLIHQIVETKTESEHDTHEMKSDEVKNRVLKPKHGFNFPLAEEIDISEEVHQPSLIRKK